MIPSPHIGIPNLVDPDDGHRLRALVIERLKRETVHSFLPLETVISSVNNKIKNFGEGRICSFHKTYFEVDKELLEKELVFRSFEDQDYVYLKDVYDNERLIQKTLKELSIRPDISLRAPITLERWNELLHDPNSPIYSSNPKEYDQIISKQSEVCSKIFQNPCLLLLEQPELEKLPSLKH